MKAALQSKFNPTTLSGIAVRVKGLIIYKFNVPDNSGSELLTASQKGDLVKVRNLIVKGANINVYSDKGATPLFYAVANDYLPIVKFLLANGADVNARNKKTVGHL